MQTPQIKPNKKTAGMYAIFVQKGVNAKAVTKIFTQTGLSSKKHGNITKAIILTHIDGNSTVPITRSEKLAVANIGFVEDIRFVTQRRVAILSKIPPAIAQDTAKVSAIERFTLLTSFFCLFFLSENLKQNPTSKSAPPMILCRQIPKYPSKQHPKTVKAARIPRYTYKIPERFMFPHKN